MYVMFFPQLSIHNPSFLNKHFLFNKREWKKGKYWIAQVFHIISILFLDCCFSNKNVEFGIGQHTLVRFLVPPFSYSFTPQDHIFVLS